jgi:spore coat protein A
MGARHAHSILWSPQRHGHWQAAFLKISAATGAYLCSEFGFVRPARAHVRHAAGSPVLPLPGGTLDPTSIPKYAMPLVISPTMPKTGTVNQRGTPIDYHEIAVRQFRQQILPETLPMTTVWSYGSVNHRRTFKYPPSPLKPGSKGPFGSSGLTIWSLRTAASSPTFSRWTRLCTGPTPRVAEGRDMRSDFDVTPGPYTGPVPIVTHLHGGHSAQESDGFSEAWYLPAAKDVLPDFATEGTWYEFFRNEFLTKWGVAWEPGTATFQNDQRATTLWYHDHTLGMTRQNIYAGPVGFYLLRGGPDDLPGHLLPGPAPGRLEEDKEPDDEEAERDEGDRRQKDEPRRFYEIPIVIQDRSFNRDGSLFYPDSRAFFDGFAGPYFPGSDVPPIWNPEFFANTMVVNGRTWPVLEVEPRRYRFRLLNACNSRFLILKIVVDAFVTRPATASRPFWQIGSDGGFLPAQVMLDQLLMAPAERADVIVDFAGLPVGSELFLINEGPDEPFGGGIVGTDFPAADPGTTGQVMKLVVVPLRRRDHSLDPASAEFKLPHIEPLGPADRIRRVSLNEEASTFPGFDGPIAAMLGVLDGANAVPLDWEDPITENPALGAVEIWDIHNFTEDAHPIHIHQVQFQILRRRSFAGVARPPESWETGRKDTVIAFPEEITRVRPFSIYRACPLGTATSLSTKTM